MSSESPQTKELTALDRAVELVNKLGKINSTILVCIRSIKTNNAYDSPRGGIDDSSRFELRRYLKASSIKIPFYFAAESRIQNQNKSLIATEDILNVFRAHELASILGLIYLYKRLRTRIPEQEDWQRVAKAIEQQIEIGGLLGQAIPTIGYADGILIGGIRHIALGLFALDDPKGYKDYRRDLKIKNCAFDLVEEKQRWSITHLDIACRLLIVMGFGQEFASNLYQAVSAKNDTTLTDEELRIRLAAFWIDSLSLGVSPAKIRGEEKHSASGDNLDKLFDECARVRKNGLDNYWISMGKKDITRESYPQLFSDQKLN
jgi:hypothetical protein